MKTVKVRIAVAVDPNGNRIDVADQASEFVDGGQRVYWRTTELPVPEAQEIAATVEEAKP